MEKMLSCCSIIISGLTTAGYDLIVLEEQKVPLASEPEWIGFSIPAFVFFLFIVLLGIAVAEYLITCRKYRKRISSIYSRNQEEVDFTGIYWNRNKLKELKKLTEEKEIKKIL